MLLKKVRSPEDLGDAGMTDVAVKRIGIKDHFVEHGSQSILSNKFDLDDEGIYKACKACVRLSHQI